MKYKILILCTVLMVAASCIKDEAPNAEADIISCILPDGIMTSLEVDYHRPFDSEQNAWPLSIEVAYGVDLTSLAPMFELTPGATIEPENGSMQDFTKPVQYIVTSESKQWQRTYMVDIHYPDSREIPCIYHFDTAKRQDNYYVFYDDADGYAPLTWASGNAGFAIAAQLQGITSPDEYPTTVCDEGYLGKCLKLQTKLTGDWGEKVGKPIAAGNLFMGSFYLPDAVVNSLGATRFGVPFTHKPLRMTGYFKYNAGEKYYDNGIYSDKQDKFSIYAMFFECSAATPYLDGTVPSGGFSHPALVATAMIAEENIVETDEWMRFDIPFDYATYGNKNVLPDKLAAGDYCIAIVFSASRDGDEFKGAPGSTLLIDEVELIFE